MYGTGQVIPVIIGVGLRVREPRPAGSRAVNLRPPDRVRQPLAPRGHLGQGSGEVAGAVFIPGGLMGEDADRTLCVTGPEGAPGGVGGMQAQGLPGEGGDGAAGDGHLRRGGPGSGSRSSASPVR